MPTRDDDTPIYLDHNATTPVDARVLEAMLPWFRETPGNAASVHAAGRVAADAVEAARGQVAALVAADPREIVFTSGATESNNLAIKGVARWYGNTDDPPNFRGRHIVTASTEHSAVLDVCDRLERDGYEITRIDPRPAGDIDPAEVREAIRDDTILVSIMWANNETGVINDIAAIGAVCRERRVLLHTDATQAAGKTPVDVDAARVDLLSASAHKMYGPKGVGALFVRRRDPRVRLVPILDGGGHERGMRSGTINVPGVVGFGAACEICGEDKEESTRLTSLRDRLESRFVEALGDAVAINGVDAPRLPHTSNVSFLGVDADRLTRATPGVLCSTGAACTAVNWQGSYVLRRMGLDDARARAAVRFGLGRDTTARDVDRAAELLLHTLQHADLTPACDT